MNSEQEKMELKALTNLTTTQINNWFINKRVRIWRPLGNFSFLLNLTQFL